jgi:hypothetical protein
MKRIQKQALAHYNRMIKWAETLPSNTSKSFLDMEISIGEAWGDDTCPYCNRYFKDDTKICPLSNGHSICDGDICCKGIFNKMNLALSWKKWIKYAKQVQDYIRENG